MGFLVAAGMAVAARGLAGDEEAGHYLIARYAPIQPELFLSLVGRPLVTAVLSLPSQVGILAARLVSALAAALCGVAVARIAVSTRWIGPFWAVGLLFVQPFFLGHAGTVMTEPWAALILAWALVGFVERRYLLMTCLVALGPLARMEVVTLWPWVIWALLASGRWRLVGILPLPILIWNGLGALWSGDPLWLAHQSNWQAYPQRSALHYLKSFVWIVGAGLFVPVLVGMARTLLLPLRRFDRLEDQPDEVTVARRRSLYATGVVGVTFFGIYTALAVWHPVTFGNLRYFAYAAPAFTVFAAAGIGMIREARHPWKWGALVLIAAGAGLWWNHALMGDFAVLRKKDYLPFAVSILWILLFFLSSRYRLMAPALAVALGIAVLPLNYRTTLHLFPTPEQEAMEQATSMLFDPLPEGTVLYAGHPLMGFHRGENFYDRTLYPPITNRLTETATPGSVFFWETHYIIPKATSLAVKPFFENRAWRYLGGVVASDSSWSGAYFLRVDPEDTSRVISGAGLVAEHMPEIEWRRTTILVQAGIPVARHSAAYDPTNEARWRTLGQRLSTVGFRSEAWKALDRAKELDPTNPYNHAYGAEILRFQKDLPGALGEAQTALALDPENGTFLYLNGRLLLDLERRTEAIPFLIAAADRMTKRWDVQWVTGHSLYMENRWEEAERFALLVQRLRPQHVESVVLVAEVSWRKGDHEEAKQRLRDFIRRIPNEAIPYLLLGDLLDEDGQDSEARAVWTEGLEKTGGDPDIASRLQ